jgi:hypothetical protein
MPRTPVTTEATGGSSSTQFPLLVGGWSTPPTFTTKHPSVAVKELIPMWTKKLGYRVIIAVLLSMIVALFGGASAALAGPTGVNPSTCGTGATWAFKDFNVNGAIMREELRHAYGCNGVGWGRLSWVNGSHPQLALIQSAWNPGGPSQGGVPNTNWTYTVDGSPGHQVCAGFQAYSVDIFGNWHYIDWFFAGCYTA